MRLRHLATIASACLALALPVCSPAQEIQMLEAQVHDALTKERDHDKAARLLVQLGDAFKGQQNFAGAEEHYAAAMLLLAGRIDARHPAVAGLLEMQQHLGHNDTGSMLRLMAGASEKYLGNADELTASAEKNLGDYYASAQQGTEAEAAYRRALEVAERVYGAADSRLVAVLDPLSQLYVRQSRFQEAGAIFKRSMTIVKQNFGEQHPDFLRYQTLWGKASQHAGREDILAATAREVQTALSGPIRNSAITEELEHQISRGERNNAKAVLLHIQLGREFEEKKKYSDALGHYVIALAQVIERIGNNNLAADALIEKAQDVLRRAPHDKTAQDIYKPTVQLLEQGIGEDNLDFVEHLYKFATLLHSEDFPQAASTVLSRAKKLYEDRHLNNSILYCKILQREYEIYFGSAQFFEAKKVADQLLTVLEKNYGQDDINTGAALLMLAKLCSLQGDYEQAEAYIDRGLKALKQRDLEGGQAHADLLQALGGFYLEQGRYDDANVQLTRAMNYSLTAIPAPSPEKIAYQKIALASAYSHTGRNDLAEKYLKEAIAQVEESRGTENNNLVGPLSLLAETYKSKGKSSEAEAAFRRAISISRRINNAYAEMGAENLIGLADIYGLQGNYDKAYPLIHQYKEIMGVRLGQSEKAFIAKGELAIRRKSFVRSVDLLATLASRSKGKQLLYSNDAFELIQLANKSSASNAVSKMSARLASTDPTLQILVRKRQDSELLAHQNEKQLAAELARESSNRDNKLEKQLRDNISELNSSLREIDELISHQFPKYFSLTKEEPLNFTSAQKLIHPDEALLTYFLGTDRSYLHVVRKNGAWLIPLNAGKENIESSVQFLRQRLSQDISDVRRLRPYDAAEAFSLYKKIFAPAEPYLAGTKNVILVLDGALETMPFAALVIALPTENIKTPDDHRKVAWLGQRYAFTTLPSVSSLRGQRRVLENPLGDQPFVGFGDPLLEGRSSADYSGRSISMASMYGAHRTIADVDAIRQLEPLPDTATELKAIAKTLHADDKALYLRNNATEAKVKQTDLSKARVLAFSTHGAMAGELKGYTEPGLILSPPKAGSELDDGYLSASEIAQLKINADWVLLSACNTAAADGGAGAEGLSGLAKAFFYAGARSLFVSHWPVDSIATRELITRMLSTYASNPEIGKSEALQQASMALMNDKEHSYFAHPHFWAPFVIAGEGGMSPR